MPLKIVDNTSASSKEREDSNKPDQARRERTEKVEIPSLITMATQTQTSGYVVANHDMPGRIRLPPILPSPTAIAASQPMPLSASTSPQDLEGGHHFSAGPYTPSSRPNVYSYFSTHDRPQPMHIAPVSPVGNNPATRPTQGEPSIPQKRPFEAQDRSYG